MYRNLVVHFMRILLKFKFLKLLLKADLFTELYVDEELRLSPIEATLLSTSIAKFTYTETLKLDSLIDGIRLRSF